MDDDHDAHPFHVVTNREVYNELLALKATTSDMRDLLQRRAEHDRRTDERLARHEERLTRLDFKFYAILAGMFAGIAYVGVQVLQTATAALGWG